MSSLREKYVSFLQLRGFAKATVRNYLQAMKQFQDWLGKSPIHMNQEDARRYLSYMKNVKRLAPQTMNIHIYASLAILRVQHGRRRLRLHAVKFLHAPAVINLLEIRLIYKPKDYSRANPWRRRLPCAQSKDSAPSSEDESVCPSMVSCLRIDRLVLWAVLAWGFPQCHSYMHELSIVDL